MENFFSLIRQLRRLVHGRPGLRLLALLPLLALATSCATVTTDQPSNITATSARLGGTATSTTAGASISRRGVAYSTTNSNPRPYTGDPNVTIAGTGNGAFSQVVTGLQTNTLYYARAFAYNYDPNQGGDGYNEGPVVQFTTAAQAQPPTLSSLSPQNGPVGTSVTLSGTNLTGTTGVSFNGTAATTFAVVNSTTLTATVPTGASSGLVTVTSPQGNSNGLAFTVSPPTNNALAFDGVDDYVSLPSSTPVPVGNGSYTMEAWIKPNSMGAFGIIGWGNYGTTNQVNALRLDASGIHNYWWANDLTAPTASLAGAWHHVAATFDGTTRRIYLDGIFQVQDNPSGHNVPNANNLRIGSTCPGPCGGEFFPGSIDEVRVYDAALTAAQIQADMFSTTSALPGSLKYYANFDQGTAGGTNTGITTLPDVSGNNSPGTLTNFALTGTASNWVRSFPTITGISPTSGPAGTSVSITGTNLTDATGFAFNGTATTGFATPTSDLTATATVPTGASTGPVSVSSATLTRYNGPVFTVNVAATTWTGTISTDWFTAGNWTAGVPTATLDAVIPGVPSGGRFPVLTAGTANVRNLTFNTGATLNQGGGILVLAANLTNNGTFQPTGGTVNLGGSTALSNVLGSGNIRFWNLTVGSSGAQQSTSASTSVQRLLTLNGNFATNGNPFTLESNADRTAMVVNNGSNVVSGTVTVQRYIDPTLNPNLGYRHVSAAVGNATVSSLATSGFSPVVNPAYNASATPSLVTPFPTVYGYDQARLAITANNLNAFDKGWYSPNATSDPLAVGQGYTVLIGGGQTWNFAGPLNNGNVTVNLARTSGATAADAGYALIGNPYPAPLDWSRVQDADRPNVGRAMYVYRSNNPANPYTGSYGIYNNGVGTISPNIAQGQGFFVRVADAQTAGSVTFNNSHRLTTYTATTFQRTAETRPLVELALQGAGSTLTDAAFVYFEQGATAGFDAQYDAEKLPNPSGLNLSTSLSATLSATQRLAIDGRAPLGTATVAVPLAVGVPAAGAYTLRAEQLLNLGTTPVYLRDLQTGAVVDLRAQPSYSFTVSNASVLLTGRFELVFSPQAPLATAPAALASQVGLYPNPATTTAFVELPAALGRTAVAAELVDALGRTVRTLSLPAQGAAPHRLDLANLATGVYTLHLRTSAGVIAKKLVVE